MWFLIDVADPGMVLRHVPEEGTARWRSLHRAVRPASLISTADSIVGQSIRTNALCSRNVQIRGETHRVLATPVQGPDGEPLAILMWTGIASDAPEGPPPVDAFIWDCAQWTVMSAGKGGSILPTGHPFLHGAWFLSRIVECEDRDTLITAAIDPQLGTEWQGPMRMITPDGDRTTRVVGTFRCRAPRRLHCLLLQVEQGRRAGIVLPTYHTAATAALLGGTTALIDTQSMQIIEWLTPPLPNIAWRHHPASDVTAPLDGRTEFNLTNTHLIHHEDMAHYLTAIMDLAAGKLDRARAVVRLLTVDHEWLPVELNALRLPGGPPRFLTCLIRPADNLPVGPLP